MKFVGFSIWSRRNIIRQIRRKTYKKVLLRNKEKEYSVDTTGMLYEICGVFYLE